MTEIGLDGYIGWRIDWHSAWRSAWEVFDEAHSSDPWRDRLKAFRGFCRTPVSVPEYPENPNSYFSRRSAALRHLGLDPDDDDWAIPDYDIGKVARHQLLYEPLDDYLDGFGMNCTPYCTRCFDDYAEPQDSLCLLCRFERDRWGV